MLFLFLTSLAFKLIRSYPKCLEDKFANVVFPIPGGPTRSNGLTPFFHFANHSTNDFRASSFPIKSRIFVGRYFSDHIIFNHFGRLDDSSDQIFSCCNFLYQKSL